MIQLGVYCSVVSHFGIAIKGTFTNYTANHRLPLPPREQRSEQTNKAQVMAHPNNLNDADGYYYYAGLCKYRTPARFS